MRVTLALPAILLAGALAARGQEPMLISGDPAAYPVSLPVSAGTATPTAAPPRAQWPAMPHYHGRGEWPGPCSCLSAPDGTVWGTCARPRSYVMHLWDGYCCERTKCPCCGWRMGSLMHYLNCTRKKCRCTPCRGCGCQQCGCASGGCASGGWASGKTMAMPAKFQHAQPKAPAPTPMRDKPPMKKPPMMKEMEKEKKAKPQPKPLGKKEKADPKVDEKTSVLDGLPAFFGPLLNGSK